jgi:hypothetical protein
MSATRRQRLADYLADGPFTVPELAELLGVPLHVVTDDLEHLRRAKVPRGSGGPLPGRLRITPAECPRCGRVFSRRQRFTRPSRCPDCKDERVSWPRLELG